MIQKFHFLVHIQNENINSKRYMHPYVYYSLIYHSQDVEAPQVPISR